MAVFRENSFDYMSDACVEARWTKEQHCHFCMRICESQTELKNHLEEQNQSDCATCYFRHYRTKVNFKLCHIS